MIAIIVMIQCVISIYFTVSSNIVGIWALTLLKILVYHKLLSFYFFLILQLGYSFNLIMYIGRLYYFIHLNNIH